MQANSPTSKLYGKIALVTGGTSGIGLATAKKFVAEEAYVFITGRRRANLDEAVKTIGQTNVTAINGDVGNLSDLDVLFEAKGTAAFSIYSASKAAVRNLARSWILDLKGRNIRINVISPGVVPTPGYDGLGLTKEQIQGFIDVQVSNIPSGRVGTPEEIAKAVTFLASDDSSFVNGIELFVDGGMTQI